ncbi:Tyrosine-specific transport protein [Senna tora]|uniref:Tyrosine-specific transport protein n=1 Tax=Senna tora TaxID=362788 RepID=A0A834WEB9_9FABA|nr:Tyrosine-specific transport protein [Senna tora]
MPSSSSSSSSCWHTHGKANNPPWALLVLNPLRNTPIGFRISKCFWYHQEQKTLFGRKHHFGRIKANKWGNQMTKNLSEVGEMKKKKKKKKKKGTIAGAMALIIGTSIGTGILALPHKASPAGFVPSSISVVVCWAFLLIEALLLVEINVGLLRKKRRKREEEEEDDSEFEVISIRTMAQETLGEWGSTLATLTYVLLGYSSMVAYCSKSGEIIFQLINLPPPVSGCLFTALFTMLISIGGTQATDLVNQWLTASMIGVLLGIEVVAVVFGGWSGVGGGSDWTQVPPAIPVIIFSLVYHDIAPVVCAYLEGDLRRIRASVFFGSLVPLMALLLWDAIALGLAAEAEQTVDPVELLFRVKWSGVSLMVGTFSLLAVGTSLIGTLLSFSEFFKEQLKYQSWISASTQKLKDDWWGRNKMNVMAMTMVVAPSLFVSTTFPDAFAAATDIAGGYGMTVLYGVVPPAMAWRMQKRESEVSGKKSSSLSNAWPEAALIMLALLNRTRSNLRAFAYGGAVAEFLIGGTSSTAAQPLQHITKNQFYVLFRLAHQLMPHPIVNLQRLILTGGACVQLLHTRGVAHHVLAAVYYQQRHLHLLVPPLQLPANPQQLERRRGAWPRNSPLRTRHRQLPLPLHLERHVRDRSASGNHAPRRDHRGHEEEEVLKRPRRLELRTDPAHGAVEDHAVPWPGGSSAAAEGDEQGDGAAEGLGVEEGREGGVESRAEGVEEGDAVVDDGIDVGDVGDEAVGEAVALVVDGASGESGVGEVNGGELEEPAGLAGVAVDEGDGADDGGGREWGPPLGEELEASGVSDELGRVTH